MRTLLVREIEAALELVRSRFISRCIILTLCSPLIPAIGVAGVIMYPCLRYYAIVDTREFLLGLASSVTIFLIVFALPLACVTLNYPQTFEYYGDQLADGKISYIEVYSPIMCYLVLLYLATYISIVSLDVEFIVDMSKKARHAAFCASTRLVNLIPLDPKSAAKVSLMNIIENMEGLPGWVCLESASADGSPVRSARHNENVSPARVRRTVSHHVYGDGERLLMEAEADELGHGAQPGSLDYLTFGLPRVTVQVSTGSWKIFRRMFFFVQHQASRCRDWSGQTALLLVFALFRAVVPRLWCTLYFKQSFIPEDPYIAAMCWHGIFLTWLIGFLWLLLFNNARLAYGENVNQLRIISAIVHLEKRHTYLTSIVAPRCSSIEEYQMLSHKLPFIAMNTVDNIKAWWCLREYVVIDTMDERVTLEITMILVFGAIVGIAAQCVYDFLISSSSRLTSFQVLSIIDMLLLGILTLKALWSYVEINAIMREQADILIQARHAILNPESRLMDMTDDELHVASGKQRKPTPQSIPLDTQALSSAEFLSHLSEIIRVDDYVQTMFGVEVTAFNVAQMVLGLIAGLGSAAGVLYGFMLKSNVLDVDAMVMHNKMVIW
jgi:hypothetical protein